MKIVFFGTPEFAVTSLDALIREGFDVAAVVTMPDKPAGRGKHLSQSAVKKYAVEHNLPVLQPEKLKDPEFVDALKAIGADLFIVIAFRMMPEIVWSMPPLGTFNLHASLLPLYRGAAPINRAVMNGDTETGVTTFFLRHDIDTGDIISQEKVAILPTDNVGDVHDRLMHLGATLTLRTIRDIIDGTLTTIPQDRLISDVEPTPAPKIFKEDCEIHWDNEAERIHNHVRGLSPYPGAWSCLSIDGGEPRELKIFETAMRPDLSAIPAGKAEIADGTTLLVGTSSCPIEILSLQAPGKRRMATPDYLRGIRGR